MIHISSCSHASLNFSLNRFGWKNNPAKYPRVNLAQYVNTAYCVTTETVILEQLKGRIWGKNSNEDQQ